MISLHLCVERFEEDLPGMHRNCLDSKLLIKDFQRYFRLTKLAVERKAVKYRLEIICEELSVQCDLIQM